MNALIQQGDSEAESSIGVVDFAELLKSIAQQVEEIHQKISSQEEINPQWLTEIETLQKESINHLVNAREQFRLKYGVDAFTEVFGAFSQGERRLNRTWSALVDQHMQEASRSITASSESMQDAVKILEKVLHHS